MSSEVPDLTGASTPLGGTEELHVVQSSNSRKTTVAELRKGTFLALTDTMSSFTANALLVTNGAGNAVASGFVLPASLGTSGQVLKVNSAEDALEFGDGGGGAITDLSDTPASLGTAGQVLKVNSAEDALEFADESGGGGDVAVEDDGSSVVAAASTLNFTGDGVTVTDAGSNQVNIAVPGVAAVAGEKVGHTQIGTTRDFGDTSGTSVQFDVSGDYDHLVVVGRGLDATSNFRVGLRFSDDGGSTWLQTNDGYAGSGGGYTSSSREEFNLSNSNGSVKDFELHLYRNPEGTRHALGWQREGGDFRVPGGIIDGDFDTIEFSNPLDQTDTFNAGTVSVYAVNNIVGSYEPVVTTATITDGTAVELAVNHDEAELIVINSDTAEARVQVSTDGGSTWLDGATDYNFIYLGGAEGVADESSINLRDGSTAGGFFKCSFKNLQVAAPVVYHAPRKYSREMYMSGYIDTLDAVTHIRIIFGGTTPTSGDVYLVEYPTGCAASGAGDVLPYARFTPPPSTGWTATDNLTGATLSHGYDVTTQRYYVDINGATAENARVGRSIPDVDFTRIFCLSVIKSYEDSNFAGIYVRNTTSGKYSVFGYDSDLTSPRIHRRDSDATFANSSNLDANEFLIDRFAPLYMKLERSGSVLTVSFSYDGIAWYESQDTEDVSSHLGGVIDEIGVYVQARFMETGDVNRVEILGIDSSQQPPLETNGFAEPQGGGTSLAIQSETGTSYELLDTDLAGNVYKEMDNASDITVTVPTGLTGTEPVVFEQAGVGKVIFSPATGVTINAFNDDDRTAGQHAVVTLIPKGSDVFVLSGNTGS